MLGGQSRQALLEQLHGGLDLLPVQVDGSDALALVPVLPQVSKPVAAAAQSTSGGDTPYTLSNTSLAALSWASSIFAVSPLAFSVWGRERTFSE